MRIDVWSDVACPWCFIGKRNLRRALDDEPPGSVEDRWRAFELRPDMPPEGLPADLYFERKFGGRPAMERVFEQVTRVGEGAGISFRFELMKWAPNTRLAHRLIAIAAETGRQEEVIEAAFSGHFERGANVGDLDELLDLVRDVGLGGGPELHRRLAADDGLEQVEADEELAARIGINGVPFFVADGRFAVTGGQPSEIFTQFIGVVRADGQVSIADAPVERRDGALA